MLVLGRFQSSRTTLGPQGARQSDSIEFSTVHSAKGREADYVIVLDLLDKRYGFPCLVVDDPLLDLGPRQPSMSRTPMLKNGGCSTWRSRGRVRAHT